MHEDLVRRFRERSFSKIALKQFPISHFKWGISAGMYICIELRVIA